MSTYAEVESALAAVHQVHADALGSFRGRIKHFQRLGLVPQSPGRGKRISYELQHVLVWAFCLELSEFGIDPTVTKAFFDAVWHPILLEFLSTTGSEKDRYFRFFPNMLSRWFLKEGHRLGLITCDVVEDLTKPLGKDSPELTRIGIINLSHVRREVEKALRTASQ
jgi:hypothetical protein